MLIQSRRGWLRIKLPRSRWLRLLLVLSALLIWSGLMFGAGVAWFNIIRPSLQAVTGRTSATATASSILAAPGRWIAARWDSPEVPKLVLDIPFKHMHAIHQKRDEALEQGLLITSSDDLVPAKVRLGHETYKVKVRLKGDLPDHLESDKWSFRIRVRKGRAILGMRRFSIQAPNTRAYQAEALFHRAMLDEGVLAPRYFFVDLVVNGKNVGLMALEEHFSKELLESQQRREGVILKFDESWFWDNHLLNGTRGPFESYLNAPITAFQSSKIEEDPDLKAQFLDASSLLRGFVDGRVAASDAFDEVLLGRFLALAEIWRSRHTVRWHNLRLYFNPVDRELEPIVFDGNLQAVYLENGLLSDEEPIIRRALEDPLVKAEFVKALRRLSAQVLDGTLPERWEGWEHDYLEILQREFPLRSPIDFEPMRRRAENLSRIADEYLLGFRTVHHEERPYPTPLHARLIDEDGRRFLELGATLPVPVEIRDVRVQWKADADGGQTQTELIPQAAMRLPATPFGELPETRRVALPAPPPKSAKYRVMGIATLADQKRPYTFEAQRYAAAAVRGLLPDTTAAEVAADHPYLRFDEEQQAYEIGPGSFEIREPLLLPRRTDLRVAPGTTLRFGPSSVVLVQGAVDFSGTEAEPIVLRAIDEEARWPGLMVLGNGTPSRWIHVAVHETSGFRLGDWEMTGAITFHESDVTIEGSSFEQTVAEDALNVIRADFTMRDCLFRDARSDAFDGDFTNGTIAGGSFERVGGDGIDFSGSSIEVDGTLLRDVRDKAISVGEGSTLTARNLVIEKCGTGAVSKDGSKTTIRDSRMTGITHVAMMAYIKKPEYGAAQLEATNVTIEGAPVGVLAQTGCRVLVDGVEIAAEDLDVDALYKKGYMKK